MQKNRFKFITVFRGVAAVIVTVGHIIGMEPHDRTFGDFFNAPNQVKLLWPFLFGREMVWLFILLSGYSLWMNYSAKIDSPGIGTYARRRLIRIIPTYYFGLGLALVLLQLPSRFQTPPDSSLDTFGPVTKAGVISHIFLIHSLNAEWLFQINPPLWSIAVELQLYLLFGIFFVGFARRKPIFTATALIIITKSLSVLTGLNIFWLSHWFFLGVIVFEISKIDIFQVIFNKYALLLAGLISMSRVFYEVSLAYEVIWIYFLANLILFFARKDFLGTSKLSKIGLGLGNCSYSLYVTHFPVALVSWWIVSYFEFCIINTTLTSILISTPLIGITTFCCYKLVEESSMKYMIKFENKTKEP